MTFSVLLRRVLAGVLLTGLAAGAAADDAACPNEFDSRYKEYPLADYERYLQGYASRCARDPAYLAWHGVVLKWLARPEPAAELLELSLMRDPAQLGARLDYADVLVMLGDREAGLALVDKLLDEPALPDRLRRLLNERQEEWSGDRWRGGGRLTTRFGYDSNLNSATRTRELSLSLPDGDVGFLLSPESRARAGAFLGLEMALDAERRIDSNNAILLLGDLRQRISHENDTDYTQGEVNALWRRRLATYEEQWLLGAGNLAYDGRSLYRVARLGYGREKSAVDDEKEAKTGLLGDCRPRLGVDVEFRSYPVVSQLDNTLVAGQLGYACHGDEVMRVQLRLGREMASAARPGGDTWRADARLIARRLFLRGWLEADFSLSMQRDDHGYSSLLANGARRHIGRFGVRLEYQQAVARNIYGLITFDAGRQNSNIELFDVHNSALALGVRYHF